jgi:chaperonin GroES
VKWLPRPGPGQGRRRRKADPHGRQDRGDKVMFNKYAGTEIKIDGDELLIMREDDILAVIEANF